MSIPCSKALFLAQAGRTLAEVVESGFTPANCIYLNVSEAFSTNPFCAYPAVIAFHTPCTCTKNSYKTELMTSALMESCTKLHLHATCYCAQTKSVHYSHTCICFCGIPYLDENCAYDFHIMVVPKGHLTYQEQSLNTLSESTWKYIFLSNHSFDGYE